MGYKRIDGLLARKLISCALASIDKKGYIISGDRSMCLTQLLYYKKAGEFKNLNLN